MMKSLARSFVVAMIVATLANPLPAFPQPENGPKRMNFCDEDSHKSKHVFEIVLENEGFDVTFGPNSKAPESSSAPKACFAVTSSQDQIWLPFQETTAIAPGVALAFQSYGGDRTGAVLLAPFLKPGTVSDTPFNHYSLLKTLEDIFDTDERLGYAAAPGLVGFFGCVSSDIATKSPTIFTIADLTDWGSASRGNPTGDSQTRSRTVSR
jgi:hypothetical protein